MIKIYNSYDYNHTNMHVIKKLLKIKYASLLFKMKKNKNNKYQNSFIEDVKDSLKNNSKKILHFPKTSCVK